MPKTATIRVTGTDAQGRDFCAGMIMDTSTQRIVSSAPILKRFIGQHRDRLRLTFAGLGYRASIIAER